MSLPSSGDLVDLSYPFEGGPGVFISSKAGIDTTDLSFSFEGSPFFASNPLSITVTLVSAIELVNSTDLISFSFGTPDIEPMNTLDQISIVVKANLQETINSADRIVLGPTEFVKEPSNTTDIVSLIVKINLKETINSSDIVSNGGIPIYVDDYSGIRISIANTQIEDNGIRLSLGEYQTDDSGINININDNTIVSVTNLFSASNTYEPTIYIGGSPVVTNLSTDPGSTQVQETDVYLHWLSTGIDGNDWTDMYNFNFLLNYSDGNFSLASKRPPLVNTIDYGYSVQPIVSYFYPTLGYGGMNRVTPVDEVAAAHLGKQVNIFGFKGTIIDFGAGIGDSQASYNSSGIFGNPLMHKQLNLLMNASVIQQIMGTNQTLTPQGIPVGDTRSLCQGIAAIAHIKFLYAIQNVPLQNTFRVDGMTAMQALSSVAALAGGVLRWNGDNSYVVAYPDQYFGVWEVPNAKLLTSAGASYSQHYDLETGLSGTGLAVFPIYPRSRFFGTAKPAPTGQLPALQRIGKINKVLTTDDPPEVFDLPPNYDKVYIQNLIGATGSTGGQIPISVRNFMTKNPSEWFEFNIAALNPGETSYIFNTYLGQTYIPQVKVDSGLFPPTGVNSSIDNGNFSINLACSTKVLPLVANNNNNQTATALNQYRFIKTYSGTITCQFFGSLPLPGMWGKATIPQGATIYSYNASGEVVDTIPLTGGDFVVEGIIEEVQLSYPGTVTVTIAQYVRVNYGAINGSTISILSL